MSFEMLNLSAIHARLGSRKNARIVVVSVPGADGHRETKRESTDPRPPTGAPVLKPPGR